MKTHIKNLLLLLLLLGLPAMVQAQDAYSTNADGSIYTYSTNADGSANIVAYAGPPWVVTIPTNINGLMVTTIGEDGFGGDSLTSVTIPGSVTNIGAYGFFQCTSLTAITVDTNNPTYSSANGVLFDKSQVTLIQYPGGLSGSYTIPGSVTSIGDYAFAQTSLTSVTIPGSVISIGVQAFGFTSLTNVTIGSGVTSIGDFAFFYCRSLTSVTIPDSVTSIGEEAFEDCSGLTNVTIGNGVTSIGDGAFLQCTSLTAITVATNNPAYRSVAGVLFDIGEDALIQYPSGATNRSYTIPGSVTVIGEGAFAGCTSLTSVTIPASVTSIGVDAFEFCPGLTSVTIPNSVTNIGDFAFARCSSLSSAYFQGNAPPDDGSVFNRSPATVYYLPGTTGWGAMFDGLPTAPWFLPNPQILNHSASFGVQPGGFGFTISWATNASVVVEAATNLANPVWIPVSTNTLTGGTNYFSDPQWTNYPGRFYRLRSP